MVIWDKDGMEQQAIITFVCGGRNTNMTYRQASLYMKESYVQLGQLEFVNCVVYNKLEVDLIVHVTTEDKNDGSWDSFYEELKCVFGQFKYHMGDFSAEV